MRFRTTLTDPAGNSVVLSEPEGLKAIIVGLTRHPELHSLVKEFKTSLRLYGSNGTQDGRRDWLKNVESVYGPDAVVTELIEVAQDDYTFETFSQSEVAIQTFVEDNGYALDHGLEYTAVQLGFWRKLMNRFDVPVDIQSATNLDGESVDVITPTNLLLTNQIISYFGEYDLDNSVSFEFQNSQINFDKIIRDDLKKFSISNSEFTIEIINSLSFDNAAAFFEAPSDGIYHFEIQIIHASHGHDVNALNWFNGSGAWRLLKSGQSFHSGLRLTKSIWYNIGGSFNIVKSYIDTTIQLFQGQQVKLLGSFEGFENVTVFSNRRLTYLTDCFVAAFNPVVLSGEQSIDGELTSSSRVLVWNQSDPTENGIYVSSAGAWTRATDADTTAELINCAVRITNGDIYADVYFRQINDKITTIGVDEITFEEFPGSYEYYAPYPSGADDPVNFINIEAKTTFKETSIESFLIHDVISSVMDRITDSGRFYSELLGSPETLARVYDESGCYWGNMLAKGMHVRGYTLAQKQFSISMKDIWEGINPHLNLSIGYETIAGIGNVIRLEERSYQYDSSQMSVLLSGVQRIKRKYNNDQYFNSVESGNSKGLIEDVSGIDDPYRQTRASIFKNIGKKLTILSSFITQSLTWEQARRTIITKSKDYKYDNDTFMVEVIQGGSGYTPKLDEDYDSVTGLLNEETRYNKRWTPARMFVRWSNYIFNGVQNYVGSVYRFVSGEGNYDMTSERKPDDCSDNYSGAVLAENGDIPVNTNHIYIPIEHEIEHYLTINEFNTIDANRRFAIGVSQFQDNHKPFFITDLQYEIMTGQIKITGFFKDPFDILTVPPGSQIFQGGKIFDATFDFSFDTFIPIAFFIKFVAEFIPYGAIC